MSAQRLTIVYFAWVRERIGKAREEVQTSAATPLELIADRIKAAGRQLVLRLAHGRREFVPPPTSHFLQPPPAVIIHGRQAMIGPHHALQEPQRHRLGAKHPAQFAAEGLPVKPCGIGAQVFGQTQLQGDPCHDSARSRAS